jgi:glycosyltransferase involved in cell wall biosynthesis
MPNTNVFVKNRSDSYLTQDAGNRDQKQSIEPGATAENSFSERKDDHVIAVSVVVPTCGRQQLLIRCMAALAQQRFETKKYEIIIVDDAPCQATQDVVNQWANQVTERELTIRYIASPGPHGPAAARNYGWRAAHGDIIAFTDDDTVASPEWLEKGLQAFKDGDRVQAVWGRIVMPLGKEPTDYEQDAKNLENAEFVTANCFILKSTLEKLGGFDERFRFAWREDADIYFRLLRSSAHIAHVPAAVVVHPIRPAHWGVSVSQQKKVQFDALLYKKHPGLYRQKIRAKPRWDYYAIVLSLLFFIVGVAIDESILSVGAACVWLALTGRFCWLRLRNTIKTPSHIGEMIVTSALIPPLSVFWRFVGALKFRVCFV